MERRPEEGGNEKRVCIVTCSAGFLASANGFNENVIRPPDGGVFARIGAREHVGRELRAEHQSVVSWLAQPEVGVG